MTDIKMPQMGESIAEGTVSVWLIDKGQYVKADQPLVTVSTDKADVDIPSPVSGVLSEVLAEAGVTVKIGELIARIDETVKGVGEIVVPPELPVKKEGPAEHPLKVEGVPAVETMKEMPPQEEVKAPPEIKPEIRKEAPIKAEEEPDRSGFYSPAVMRMAVERGIDVRTITGTGLGGRVTKSDIMGAAEGKPPSPTPSPGRPHYGTEGSEDEKMRCAAREEIPPSPPFDKGGMGGLEGFGTYTVPTYEVEEGDVEMPFSRLRRLIADHMVYSKRTSAHVTTFAEVDLDRIVGIRETNKAKFKSEMGISLTFLPFVMLAAVRALKEFPTMNTVVQGDRILTKHHIHLGVAVDSERGLMVPVIKSAEDMGLVDLAKAVNELSIKVRDKKITPDELSGGTFTVTNPGKHGNLFGTPIISQPQVGVLRMGEVVKRAVVVEADGEDAIAIRPMMFLSLSYDHRVVDGLTANEFLHRIKEHLEEGEFGL